MKVGECIIRGSSLKVSADKNGEFPPLEEAVVKRAKSQESITGNNIWIDIESASEYSAISYKVRDEFKAQVKAIIDFINENKGKRLLEVLGMELP